jgi:hypothetical protein
MHATAKLRIFPVFSPERNSIFFLPFFKTHRLVLQASAFCPQNVFVSQMFVKINSDCFPKQQLPVGLCSGDVICFLRGRN